MHIRLVNSHSRADYEGRVEIYHDNTWGSICDEDWDKTDADVICKQLGFEGATNAFRGSFFGANDGIVWLNNVQCTGYEETFFNCAYNGWGYQECPRNQIAGLSCVPPKFGKALNIS